MLKDELVQICIYDFVCVKDGSHHATQFVSSNETEMEYMTSFTIALPSLPLFAEVQSTAEETNMTKPLPIVSIDTVCLKLDYNDFGFLSWLPNDKKYQSIITEHKITPNPYTTNEGIIPNHRKTIDKTINCFCGIVNSITNLDHKKDYGVNCLSFEFGQFKYRAMFKKGALTATASYVDFSVSEIDTACYEHSQSNDFVDYMQGVTSKVIASVVGLIFK